VLFLMNILVSVCRDFKFKDSEQDFEQISIYNFVGLYHYISVE